MSIAVRRSLVLATAIALMAAMVTVLAPRADAHGAPDRTYRVTVRNLTDHQLLTPAVVATHQGRTRIFREGRPASTGIRQLAENGGVPVLVSELEGTRGVHGVVVAGSAPIAPGASVETLVTAGGRATQLSLAAMLICTNDGFAAVANVGLPSSFGRERVILGGSYDAGTEVNTERYADLVPPCDGMGQTGMSNPALAEGGVVRHHMGIRGVGDLTVAGNGWTDPAIEVTIERVRIFEITVSNLTDGQLTTPFVVATHRSANAVFRPGRPASAGLQSLAENGGVPDLVAELGAARKVGTVAVLGSGPVAPGTSVTSTVVVDDGYRRLSVAGMLICTNDGFGGVNGMRLPTRVGATATAYGDAYDAGTEVNTELYADLVPPCDGIGQAGMSNPALAEGDTVHPHPGIKGTGDLSAAIHGWSDPVIEVTVTKTG
jgi:hypothetical protein